MKYMEMKIISRVTLMDFTIGLLQHDPILLQLFVKFQAHSHANGIISSLITACQLIKNNKSNIDWPYSCLNPPKMECCYVKNVPMAFLETLEIVPPLSLNAPHAR